MKTFKFQGFILQSPFDFTSNLENKFSSLCAECHATCGACFTYLMPSTKDAAALHVSCDTPHCYINLSHGGCSKLPHTKPIF